MKVFYLALMLMLCATCIQAQQYIIRYDLAGENVEYLKVKKTGDTVSASVVHLDKSTRVNLQLVNASSGYKREVRYVEKNVPAESVLIPGFGGPLTKNLLPGGLPPTTLKSLGLSDISNDRRDDSKGLIFDEETNQQKLQRQLFSRYLVDFNTTYAAWQKSLQLAQNCKTLWKELALLRYNLQADADQVKQNARIKTWNVFPDAGDDPTMILESGQNRSPAVLTESMNKIFIELQKVYSSYKENNIQSAADDGLFLDAFKKKEKAGSQPAPITEMENNDVVKRIADLYGQILNDSYSQVTPLTISNKTTMAEIRFIPEIDPATSALINLQKSDTIKKWIPVFKKETLRFRNTFGFSFVSFAENRWRYFVNANNVIARETADQFQPVVVTYLHFYSPRDKGFRWGGSFGAGLPVGGDNTKMNIMLGLSTFLGKNDPVCISAGVSGTQVKKLSGFNLGDKVTFSTLTENNFATVYRVGYFLALTFNPGSLNTKD